MSDRFDAYYTWLGIPPNEQPPGHYRLLGVRTFENHAEVIENAFVQRTAHIRSFLSGPRAAEANQILEELSLARECLANAEKKGAYDRDLRQKDAPRLSRPASVASPRPTRPSAPHKSGPLSGVVAATAANKQLASGSPQSAAPAVAPAGSVGGGSQSLKILVILVVAGLAAFAGLFLLVIAAAAIWWFSARSAPLGERLPVAESVRPNEPDIAAVPVAPKEDSEPLEDQPAASVEPPTAPKRAPLASGEFREEDWPELEANVAWVPIEPSVADQIEQERAKLLSALPEVSCDDLISAFMQGVIPARFAGGAFSQPGGQPEFPPMPGGIPPGVIPPPGAFGPPQASLPPPELPERFILSGRVANIRHDSGRVWFSVSGGSTPNAPPGFPPRPLVVFENSSVGPLLCDYRPGDTVQIAVQRIGWNTRSAAVAAASADWAKTPFVERYGAELRLFANRQSPLGSAPRWVFLALGVQKDPASWVHAEGRRAARPKDLASLERSLAWHARGGSAQGPIRGQLRGAFASANESGGAVQVALRTPYASSAPISLTGTLARPVRLDEFADYRSGDEIVAYGEISSGAARASPPRGVASQALPADPETTVGAISFSLAAIRKAADPASLIRPEGPRRELMVVSLESVQGKAEKFLGKEINWRGNLQRLCRYKGETHLLVRDSNGSRYFECYTRHPEFYANLADYRDGRTNPDVVAVVARVADQDSALFRLNKSAVLVELQSAQRVNYAPSLAEVGQARSPDSFETDRYASAADALLRDVPMVGEPRALEARFDSFSEYSRTLSLTTEGRSLTRLRPTFPDGSKADFARYRRGDRVRVVLQLTEEPLNFESETTYKWQGLSIEKVDPPAPASGPLGAVGGYDEAEDFGGLDDSRKRPPLPGGRPASPGSFPRGPDPTEPQAPDIDEHNEKLEELANARLQVGRDFERRKNSVAARNIYREVIARYPKTAAAEKARALLQPKK